MTRPAASLSGLLQSQATCAAVATGVSGPRPLSGPGWGVTQRLGLSTGTGTHHGAPHPAPTQRDRPLGRVACDAGPTSAPPFRAQAARCSKSHT